MELRREGCAADDFAATYRHEFVDSWIDHILYKQAHCFGGSPSMLPSMAQNARN